MSAPAWPTADGDAPMDAVAAPAQGASSLDAPAANVRALIEVQDRTGRTVARQIVTRWPVVIGRSLQADLVLDDPHVAPQHLRMDRDDGGRLPRVEVLDEVNGVTNGRVRHRSGQVFEWGGDTPLDIGRLHLRMRLADAPVPPAAALPHFPWGSVLLTLALLLAVVLVEAGSDWLEVDDPQRRWQRLPGVALGAVGALSIWAGLWALAGKLFGQPLNWMRHLRIVCAAGVGAYGVALLAHLTAFMFSWESLALHESLIWIATAGAVVAAHLALVAPRQRRLLAVLAVSGTAAAALTLMGSQWMQHQRLTREFYMASLFPPGWRVAPAVPVRDFLNESAALKARVDDRLKEAAEDSDDDE